MANCIQYYLILQMVALVAKLEQDMLGDDECFLLKLAQYADDYLLALCLDLVDH